MSDMLPLALVVFSIPILGQIVGKGEWLGITIAVIGVLVASIGTVRVGGAAFWAYCLPVIGMMAMAAVTLLHKKWTTAAIPIYQGLCLQCLASAAAFLPFAVLDGSVVPPASPGFWIGNGWLVLLATYGSYGLYYVCLRNFSPTRVSNVLYLSPPVAMLWARIMFDEPLSFGMVLGLVVTLLGVSMAARNHGGSR